MDMPIKNALLLGIALIFLSSSSYLRALPTQQLIQLNDENYMKREQAHAKIHTWLKSAKEKDIEEMKKYYGHVKEPEVKVRLEALLKEVDYTPIPNTKGFVGISMRAGKAGVIVGEVHPNTPAAKAGIKANDEIIELDGVKLKGFNQKKPGSAVNYLSAYVKQKKAGQKLKLKLLRGGKEIEMTLKLGSYDEFQKKQQELLMRQLGFGGNFQGGFPPPPPPVRIQPQRPAIKITPEQLKKLQEENKKMEKRLKLAKPFKLELTEDPDQADRLLLEDEKFRLHPKKLPPLIP